MFSITSKWPHQENVHVEWNLGKRCNLDCGYCPADIHDNYSPHTNLTTLLKTIDTLKKLNKPTRLSLTGGEPCVHPDIEELLDYAKKNLNWVNVTTNGLRTGKWYADRNISHYVFSIHFDNTHWNRALDNIIEFASINEDQEKIPFQVNVMAHHSHMNNVKFAVNKFKNYNIRYVVRRIRWTEQHDWFDDMRYNQEDLDWILENDATALPNCIVDKGLSTEQYIHANDIIKHKLNQFEGWSCSAGIESLMINWDGEVHRATCRVGGSLGNIYKDNFKVPTEWINCTRKFCTCAADVPLSKYNPRP
jgi:MoaA/NifB/PqqE/SkfB family radical SAM enzyme